MTIQPKLHSLHHGDIMSISRSPPGQEGFLHSAHRVGIETTERMMTRMVHEIDGCIKVGGNVE